MIRHILVPTDFSPCADKAIEFSISLSELTGARITFMTCFQIPIVTTDITYTYDVELVKKFQEDSEARFNDLKIRFPRLENVEFDTLVDLGYPQESIIEKAKSDKYDIMIMGTKGATGFTGDLLGSITSSVLKRSHIPVIVIPESWKIGKINKIAMASDYHTFPEFDQFETLIDLISTFNAELLIVNVKASVGETTFDEAYEAKKLDNYLTGITHSFHFVTGSDVAEALENFIVEKEIGMLVILPRDHSFLDRLFHKSTTRQVALHTKTPFLTLHVED